MIGPGESDSRRVVDGAKAPALREPAGDDDRVVEGLVSLDLLGVAFEVLSVGLVGHRLGRPAPRLAVLGPETLAGAHDRRVVDVDVLAADGAEVVAGGQLLAQGVLEVVREPAHRSTTRTTTRAGRAGSSSVRKS